MNSTRRSNARRSVENPQPTYKVRLADGTMAVFPTLSRAAAVSAAIRSGSCQFPHQVGYILLP